MLLKYYIVSLLNRTINPQRVFAGYAGETNAHRTWRKWICLDWRMLHSVNVKYNLQQLLIMNYSLLRVVVYGTLEGQHFRSSSHICPCPSDNHIIRQYVHHIIHSNIKQSAGRHVAPLGHIIMIPSQLDYALTPSCCVLNGDATNTIFIVFSLTRPGL